MKRESLQRRLKRAEMRRNKATFIDRVQEAIRTGRPVRGINWTTAKPAPPTSSPIHERGGLLIPFSLVISALALLLGAMLGNSIGRHNATQGTVSVLDVKPISRPAPPTPALPAVPPDPVLSPSPDLQP